MTDFAAESTSIQLTELAQRLGPAHAQLELPALWTRFREQVPGAAELSAFVRWLELQGLIDEATAAELLAELAVEVTGLDVLGGVYDQTRTIDLKHGDLLSPVPKLQSGKTNYLMLKQVGAGAMGEVHLAKDRLLRRTVAFKQLLRHVGDPAMDPVVVQRFLGEAQITSQLDHPHVVPIYGLETSADGQIAYTMKMVHGDSLKQWLAKVKAAYQQGQVRDEYRLGARIRLFLKICDALSFAHSKGVIHRDLKPANVMLGRYGEVYVMDWGIARPFGPDALAGTRQADDPRVEVGNLELYALEDGQIVGTPRYMSPEQGAGMNNELDQRSDLYAMGLILFEMVSLRQAIQAKNMQATLQKVVRGQLEPLVHLYGEAIPPGLAAIIAKATARRRKDRYGNLGELAEDLQRFLADEKVLAHQETTLQALQRAVQRHRQKVLPALLGILLLGGAMVLGVQWLKQVQVAEAEAQRLKTGQLMAALADHGQQLGGHFQLLEGYLQQLSAAAGIALSHGQAAADPIYFASELPRKAPRDFAPAPGWPQPISLDWPVMAPANGKPSLSAVMSQLSPLRFACRRILQQSRGPAFAALQPSQQNDSLRRQAGELRKLFVMLADGTSFVYPGQAEPPLAVAPRQQNGNSQAVQGKGFAWGAPGQTAHGTVIAGVQPLRDAGGHLLGVAGLELSLADIARQWLPMKSQPAVEAVYLVTPMGQVMAADPPVKQTQLLQAEPLAADLLAELSQSGSGFVRVDNRHFLAHTYLDRLGWQLVVRGNAGTLLRP